MAFAKKHKRLISLFFALSALLLFCVNALLVFVVTGPRSLNSVTPYIEAALAPPNSPYQVKIEGSELVWDGWQHPIAVHVKNVQVMTTAGVPIATFPEIGVRMYFLELLRGKIDLKSIEVLHPTAVLVQGVDGSLSFGFGQSEAAANNSIGGVLALISGEEGDNPLTHLRSLIIRHAALSVKKASAGVFLNSPDASLEITRSRGKVSGILTMPLQFSDKTGELAIDFGLSGKDKSVSAEVTYTDIPSAVLHELFPAQEWMNAGAMPLSGWANVTSDFDANISTLDFMFEAGPGIIDYPAQFEKPIALQRLHLEGSLTDKMKTLTVKQGIFDVKGFSIGWNGTIHKEGDDYGVDVTANSAHMPIDEIHHYWPLGLAPHTRDWVIKHVSRGETVKGNLALHFKPGDFKLKDTPEQDIDATMEVKGATIQYLAKHPAVSNIDGVIHFTGGSMDAKVTQASDLSDTRVTAARIRFPDMNADDVRIFIDMDVIAPAKDVVEFLSLPDLNKAKTLNLTQDVSGKVTGNAKLDFIAFSEDERKTSGRINYAITADLLDVSQPNFMDKYDVGGATMKLSVNNKGIKANGRASINRLPMRIDLATSFARGGETTYTVKLDMPIIRLPDFGLPALDFAKGNMGVDATFLSSDGPDKVDATLDLTSASINLPEHGFSKKTGEKATLKLSTEGLASGNTLFKSFAFSGTGFSAAGKGEIDRSGTFHSLTFDTLRFGNQDLNYLDYAKTSDTLRLVAKGRSLDLSPYINKGKKGDMPHAYDLDIKTDRLVLGEKRGVKDASVRVNCAGGECSSADVTAKLESGTPFAYTLHGGNLHASCNDAGELLRTLGVFDGIDGGKMTVEGVYANKVLEGQLLMTDYKLNHAPILTKIITIASLTGILDTLSGNGIAFVKMTAPFRYGHDTLILKDAKAYGAALGITTDGTVDFRHATLDLHGTLVPSYTVNSLVGDVPLIGSLLVGGKGKGLIALNYSVNGDMNDPSISVNPLSVFTPGFMRGIFDIFDKPAPDFDKIEADQKAEDAKSQEKPVKPVQTAPTILPQSVSPQNNVSPGVASGVHMVPAITVAPVSSAPTNSNLAP